MIKPSPELLALSRRFFGKIIGQDTKLLHAFLSADDSLRFIGTGDEEYWSGQAVRDGISDFFGAMPAVKQIDEIEAEAFECGTCGWSSFVFRAAFVGRPKPHTQRETLVFALQGADWKIVQRHGSVPVPNSELLGVEQTAIQNLVDAARQGFSLDQREGLASVMFTDVVSSSVLAEAMGDAAWSDRIGAHFAWVRQIVTTAGGQFVKSLGDGTLSSFPSARAALQAAAKIQRELQSSTTEPHLTLRIGIHTGDVVRTDGDFFGSVVNKAARITSVAGAGQIGVSEATRAMVGAGNEFGFSGPTQETLRGFDGQHPVYRLEWQA